jgi:hypothetical protein
MRKKSGARLALRVRNAKTANPIGPIAEPFARHNRFAGNIIMNILDIGVEAEGLAILERERESRRLHVTEVYLDMVAAVADTAMP